MAAIHYLKMEGLLPALTVLFICLIQTIHSAPLSSYLVSNFTSPDPDLALPFNHITINNITGDVYIGARERLYQLHSDLTLKQKVNTGSCPPPNENTNNYNKLLVVAPPPENKLITCGGCDGYCETRSLTNISHDVAAFNASEEQLVVTTEDAPTVGAVVWGAEFEENGVGTEDYGLYLFKGVSLGSQKNPSISKHNLVDLIRDQTVQEYDNAPEGNFFRHVIAYKDYLYYFISRGESEQHVYLGRLCRNSLDGDFASYSEIELQCGSYSEIKTAHIGPAGSQLADSWSIKSTDDILYAVFSSGSSSALCAYKMSDVLQRFKDAVFGCIEIGNTNGTTNDYLQGSMCNTLTSTPPDSVQCNVYYVDDGQDLDTYKYASGTVPLSASPIIPFPNVILTSIVTTIERNHTVAFMGDNQGRLHKVNIVNSLFGYVYENVSLGSGSVLRDMFLDESKEQITLATSSEEGSQVLILNLTNCGQYQTCDECLGVDGENDGDPYCGWCTLEARCTRYEACPFSSESTRWLSYNALECVSISNILPNDRLPYHETEQEIDIIVQQLPDPKDTYEYHCAFDMYLVPATTLGNTVTCRTPPESEIPDIPIEMDHVTLDLSIFSTETQIRFVTTDFTFFDCSRINSCSSCVTSPYPCDWCVYDNRCTDDSISCVSDGDTVVIGDNNLVGSGNRGQGFCPQLLGTTESFLIPVNISSGYSLSAKNLPTDQSKGLISYECILHIEGEEVRVHVPSTNFNDTYILCSDEQYMYNENILMKNVSVSVQWNGQNNVDDLSETYVTLYNCSVNSGSCSRCLSEDATPSILKCGWCGIDCNVIQSDVCQNNQFLRQNDTQLCAAPVITDFNPMSGPVNGRTRLEITGTDIGVEFEDVQQIFIQDLECDLTDMDVYYQPGQSVSCLTGISNEEISGRIKINVNSGGENKTGESTDDFQYRDPVIEGFNPREGPVAGGTEITISGIHLDTGRDITAKFGEAKCEDISVQDTVATCITSSITQNEQVSLPLTMTFDDVEKPFADYYYIYMPNPRITDIDRTESIMSGGTDITLTGDRFDLIQEPKIVVSSLTTNASNFELCNGTETILTCPTPSFPDDAIPVRRRRAVDDAVIANLTFDFDGYIIDKGTIEYFSDPVYENFSGDSSIYKSGNQRLEIIGMNLNLASTEDDVQVFLGPDGECNVDDLEIDVLRCQLPDKQPQAGDMNGTLGQGDTSGLPAVTVKHGNLWFYPGFVEYSSGNGPNIPLIVGPVGGAIVIFIVMALVAMLLVKRRQKAIDQQVEELELLEKKIQNRAEEAYHNLQVDMTEVEEQVRGLGIPFVNTQDYARNMLFSGLDILPATADPEYLDADLERAMITFSRQLNNPDFLIKYIQELEESRKSHRRDRVNIASLITVILVSEGKFDYFTKILKRLLEEQIIEAAETGRQLKSLFRRTETIIEKLLANWLSLCMYHYLKKHVAKSLYLLYQSIKIQVEKGPIDIITGQSYFSLNFDCLLEEDVPYEEMTLSVVGANGQHEYYVTVLSTDCITQTKQKILDSAYRRKHYVKQSRAHELDLLWYHPGGEQRILRDQDEYNTPKHGSMVVHVNTLKSVGVTSDCRVAMINKVGNLEDSTGNYTPVSPGAKMFYIYDQQGSNDVRDRDYTRIQTQREGGYQLWHLLSEDQLQGNDKQSRTKLDKEFSAPHLLVTKKTIEPFLNQFLAAVFENPDLTPVTIKHLFDFYDEMASSYCPDHPQDYSEAWKSNSLPQHYWVTTLTHPSYIFDMRQSRSADQSVSVLANMLDNACKKIIPKKKQDAALNRVLFVKDLPRYIRTISEYYKNLASRSEPTHIELQGEYNRLGQEFSGLFSRVGTLKLLYDFTLQDTAGLLDSITEMM